MDCVATSLDVFAALSALDQYQWWGNDLETK
jgi:hypothetical protein